MNLVSHLAEPSLGVVLLGDAGRGTHVTPPQTHIVVTAYCLQVTIMGWVIMLCVASALCI
jgi:hypothetical protein